MTMCFELFLTRGGERTYLHYFILFSPTTRDEKGRLKVSYWDHVAEEGQEDAHFAATSLYLALEEITGVFPELREFTIFAGGWN